MPKIKVTAKELIDKWAEAYRDGHNIAWVARELDISRQALEERVSNIRKRGTKLPKLARYNAGESKQLRDRLAKELGKS